MERRMKLKDINLIPNRIQYKRKIIFKNAGKILLIVLVVAVLLGLAAIRPIQIWKLNQDNAKLASEINKDAINEITTLKKTLNDKTLENQKIDSNFANMPTEGIKLTELIKRSSKIMPTSISFEVINYDYVKKEINFDLVSKNFTDIALFLKCLYNDSIYTNINISAIIKDKSIYKFSLTMNFTNI